VRGALSNDRPYRNSHTARAERVSAWRKKVAKGDVIVVRYADDLVVGFERRAEAERFLNEFRKRLAKFGLELHPEKTRLIQSLLRRLPPYDECPSAGEPNISRTSGSPVNALTGSQPASDVASLNTSIF
jgi:hypothetical protein